MGGNLAFILEQVAGDLCRDVDQPSVRVIAHRLPVMGAKGAGDDQFGRVAVVRQAGFDRPARFHIDAAGPIDRDEVLSRDQFARGPVQHVKEAVLGGLHQHGARVAVDLHVGEDDVLGGGVVPGVTRRGLVMPDILACVGF